MRSQMSRRSTHQKSYAQAFREEENMGAMNNAVDKLKLKYQPLISTAAELLEKRKQEHSALMVRK